MFKSYISWRAIDTEGRLQCDTFSGGQRYFKKYIKQQQLHLLSSKRHYQLALTQRRTNFNLTFTTDLAVLLNSGFELTIALSLLKNRYRSPVLQQCISKTLSMLHNGQSLSTALTHYPQIFPTLYLPLLKVAEATQQLPHILTCIVTQQHNSITIKNKLQKALIYPASVFAFTVFITIGLLTFAIPQFQAIFNNFNAQLPAFTQHIIDCSHLITKHKYALLLGSSSLTFGYYLAYKRFSLIRRSWQTVLMHLPWIKLLYRLKLIFNWCTVLTLGLNAELTIKDCLPLANDALTNITFKKRCQTLAQHLADGQPLYRALTTTRLLNEEELYIIQLGETSNQLPQSLERIATEAARKLEQQLENLSKWLEPVIMLILAVVTGGLIISMYLPIFKLGAIL